MNLKWFGSIAVVALVGSFIWNGFKTPLQSDEEWLRSYKITHSTNASDEQLLKLKYADEKSSKEWKASNKILDEAMKARGIELQAGQKALEQMMFYDAYYNHKATAEQFLDKRYKDEK